MLYPSGYSKSMISNNVNTDMTQCCQYYCSFVCAWMTVEAKTRAETKKTVKPWKHKWMTLVPKFLPLQFCLLKKRRKPEVDVQCISTPGYMAGTGTRVLSFMTMGIYEDYNVSGRDGIHLTRRHRAILCSRLANPVRQALKLRTLGVRSPKRQYSHHCNW